MSVVTQGWLEAARRIIQSVQASGVDGFELTHGDFHIRVRRQPGVGAAQAQVAAPTGVAAYPRVTAPLTGVFYRSASPTSKQYAAEGEWVDADTVVGLIETMKIFNEVTADRAGRIVRFLVEPGQLVQAGDPLLELEPGERSPAGPAGLP